MSGGGSILSNSIKEINADSWLIGNDILLCRGSSQSSYTSWSDGKGSLFSLSKAFHPLPPTRQLTSTNTIRLIYDAGGVSAVWNIGVAFCKIKILDQCATREHVTLSYLLKREPLSFAVPHVYHHAKYDGRYYLFISKLRGQTLGTAWATMPETVKTNYVFRVANICKELAAWQGETISGVDGQNLSDHFLTKSGLGRDCSPEILLQNCREMGLECTRFYFYHCDLGPGNIIVDVGTQFIGIIDWETAGFVPKEWIRTKFCLSSGMNLPDNDPDWRRRLRRALEEDGFDEISDQWMNWWNEGV